MRLIIPAASALAALLAFGAQANAGTFVFGFSGAGGVVAHGSFTAVPNVSPADPNPACGTPGNNPCRSDPPGAMAITGISGSFTYAAGGVFDAPITSLIPISPANERDLVFDPLVPTSLSFIDYNPPSGYLTYNNLYFPGGSPIDCAFPFAGTFLDVFGLAFTVEGGYTVDIWGDGDLHGPGTLTYGIAIVQGSSLLSYQFDGASAMVPEPASMALLGTGLVGMLARRRRRG